MRPGRVRLGWSSPRSASRSQASVCWSVCNSRDRNIYALARGRQAQARGSRAGPGDRRRDARPLAASFSRRARRRRRGGTTQPAQQAPPSRTIHWAFPPGIRSSAKITTATRSRAGPPRRSRSRSCEMLKTVHLRPVTATGHGPRPCWQPRRTARVDHAAVALHVAEVVVSSGESVPSAGGGVGGRTGGRRSLALAAAAAAAALAFGPAPARADADAPTDILEGTQRWADLGRQAIGAQLQQAAGGDDEAADAALQERRRRFGGVQREWGGRGSQPKAQCEGARRDVLTPPQRPAVGPTSLRPPTPRSAPWPRRRACPRCDHCARPQQLLVHPRPARGHSGHCVFLDWDWERQHHHLWQRERSAGWKRTGEGRPRRPLGQRSLFRSTDVLQHAPPFRPTCHEPWRAVSAEPHARHPLPSASLSPPPPPPAGHPRPRPGAGGGAARCPGRRRRDLPRPRGPRGGGGREAGRGQHLKVPRQPQRNGRVPQAPRGGPGGVLAALGARCAWVSCLWGAGATVAVDVAPRVSRGVRAPAPFRPPPGSVGGWCLMPDAAAHDLAAPSPLCTADRGHPGAALNRGGGLHTAERADPITLPAHLPTRIVMPHQPCRLSSCHSHLGHSSTLRRQRSEKQSPARYR